MIGTKRPRIVKISFDSTLNIDDLIEDIRLYLTDYDGRLLGDYTKRTETRTEVYAEMKKDLELGKFEEDFRAFFPITFKSVNIEEVEAAA